jgi:hypothetical protein
MPLFVNSIDKATADVRKFREARVSLEERVRKAREEMERLRHDLPGFDLAGMLNGDDGTAKGLASTRRARVRELQDELEACAGVERPLVEKLRDASLALNRAKASEIRKRADALSVELSGHRTKVEKLAEQLWSLEGVQYVPNIFPMGQHGLGGDGPIPFCVTKTMRLTQERDALVAEADALENKQAQGAGLDATSLDEVLAKVEAVDLGTIPPTVSAVRAFFAEALREAERDFDRADYNSDFAPLGHLPRELNISMTWDANGEIQPGSRVTIRLAPITRQLATERFGAEYAQPLSE